jgi:uncharacterized protein
VKIAGAHRLAAPQDRAYELLQDPGVLGRCMPGCEGLDRIADNEYAMRMKMALGSASGLFDGKVTLADLNPPEGYRLIVEGSGKIGFMRGEGVLTLSPVDEGTTVGFEGDVQVGGTIAAVGQRLLDVTAKMLIKRFFEKVDRELIS